ncbi:MAG: DUF4349 domain-containing protein [Bacteroidota bacterium]
MKKYLLSIAIITIVFGCQSERKDYASSESLISNGQEEVIAANDTIPKIIKTADMRFKVKDVQQTKSYLSTIIKSEGGMIAEFSINSTIEKSDKVKYSIDSLKEITSYRKEGILIAKIPSEKLDEFTNAVAKNAVFVDHQSMKMDDQSITYLANTLKTQNRVAALNTINKTAKKQSNNVESSLYIKDDYIDKQIENININNRVKFSTITLNFYQDNTIKTLIIGNDNLYDYRPGFFQRLGLNVVDGWVYFKEFILAISHLWMLAVLGFTVYFGSRYYIRRKKS